MITGQVERAVRLRIGIGPAAGGKKGHGAGMRSFQEVLCIAGPIAIDVVVVAAQRCAMTAVAENHGA